MKFKGVFLTNILLAGSLLALPAIAMDDQGAPEASPSVKEQLAFHPHECGPMHQHEDFFKELGLTDEQLEKFADLKNQYNLATASKKAELKSLCWKMHDLMTQPTLDKQSLQSVHDKITALKDDLSNTRFNYAFERASVLSPDQRAKIRHRMLVHQLKSGHRHHEFGHHEG